MLNTLRAAQCVCQADKAAIALMLTALSEGHQGWVPLQVQHAATQSCDLLAGSPTSRWAAPVLWGIFAGVAVRLPATRMEENMSWIILRAG